MNLEFTDLGKIKEQKKPFAWFPFIPRNEVTILVSNGGVGKTFFGLDILARLSNGVTMPNKSQGAYKPNTPTAIVSSETSKEEFAKRLRELFGKCPKSKKCSCVDVVLVLCWCCVGVVSVLCCVVLCCDVVVLMMCCVVLCCVVVVLL